MHAFPCAAGRGYKRTQAGCAPTTSASDLDARIWAIARSLVDCGIYKRIYIDARFPDVGTISIRPIRPSDEQYPHDDWILLPLSIKPHCHFPAGHPHPSVV
jgi:hypothetical protein